MKRVLKWLGIVVGGLIGLLVLALVAAYLISSLRMNKTYEVQAEEIAVPTDAETIAYGKRLVTIRGCTGCHGEGLSGETLVEDPALGKLYSANLTGGQGSDMSAYTDALLARAIRHGVDENNKPLLVMPSHEFYVLSNEDVGAIIAYLHSLPAVDHERPKNSIGPLGRVLYLAGVLDLVPAELIDHEAARPPAPEPGVTVEYGAYMAVVCQGCHGQDYAGGRLPGSGPDDPIALNLTPGGELAGWSEEDFITVIRTGIRPSGTQLADAMPWREFKEMTDEELKAVWVFLQSLPPREQG